MTKERVVHFLGEISGLAEEIFSRIILNNTRCTVIDQHYDSSIEKISSEDGTKSKIFYGMSSEKAMTTYFGEVEKHIAPEGKEVRFPYKVKVENTIQSILGGVRSACSYVGARRIKDLPKCTTFVRVTITTNEIYTSHEVS